MPKNNMWKWKAKGSDGKPMESAPGSTEFISRGPESIVEMKKAAEIILRAFRQREFDNTGKDPGYALDGDPEPMGHSDTASEIVGDWKPVGATPVDFPLPVEPPPTT